MVDRVGAWIADGSIHSVGINSSRGISFQRYRDLGCVYVGLFDVRNLCEMSMSCYQIILRAAAFFRAVPKL